jgi:hypothetical protein
MYYNGVKDGKNMEAPVTLRLDPKTRRQIARVARRKGISNSEVIPGPSSPILPSRRTNSSLT